MAVSVSLSQHVFIKTAVVDENEVDVSCGVQYQELVVKLRPKIYCRIDVENESLLGILPQKGRHEKSYEMFYSSRFTDNSADFFPETCVRANLKHCQGKVIVSYFCFYVQ